MRQRRNASFYRKHQNEEVAAHLAIGDIAGTDLATVIEEVKQRAEESRRF